MTASLFISGACTEMTEVGVSSDSARICARGLLVSMDLSTELASWVLGRHAFQESEHSPQDNQTEATPPCMT